MLENLEEIRRGLNHSGFQGLFDDLERADGINDPNVDGNCKFLFQIAEVWQIQFSVKLRLINKILGLFKGSRTCSEIIDFFEEITGRISVEFADADKKELKMQAIPIWCNMEEMSTEAKLLKQWLTEVKTEIVNLKLDI